MSLASLCPRALSRLADKRIVAILGEGARSECATTTRYWSTRARRCAFDRRQNDPDAIEIVLPGYSRSRSTRQICYFAGQWGGRVVSCSRAMKIGRSRESQEPAGCQQLTTSPHPSKLRPQISSHPHFDW